jgi:ribonuclease R
MEKAIYSPYNEGHYGLGLEDYLHFTSPIRRYPDLIVHRTLKDFVINKDRVDKNTDERMEFLHELAKLTSDRERTAMYTERQLADIKKTRLMKDKVGTSEEGTIVTITNFGIFVELENFTQGLIRFDKLEMDEVINTNGQKVKLIKGDKE